MRPGRAQVQFAPERKVAPPYSREVDLSACWREIAGQRLAYHLTIFGAANGNGEPGLSLLDSQGLRDGDLGDTLRSDGSGRFE